MKSSLIVGGNGSLGKCLVQTFKKGGWSTVSLDLHHNEEADVNILVDSNKSMKDQASRLLKAAIDANKKYDSIICAAGGFNLSSVKDMDIFDKYEEMDKMNFQTALMAAHIAAHTLNNKGFVVLTGAAAAYTSPINYAYAYGVSKAATHSLAMTLAQRTEIPADSCVVTLLPTVIDTEANRQSMPGADTKEWIDPKKLASLVYSWANGEQRPLNGSFGKICFKKNTIVPNFL